MWLLKSTSSSPTKARPSLYFLSCLCFIRLVGFIKTEWIDCSNSDTRWMIWSPSYNLSKEGRKHEQTRHVPNNHHSLSSRCCPHLPNSHPARNVYDFIQNPSLYALAKSSTSPICYNCISIDQHPHTLLSLTCTLAFISPSPSVTVPTVDGFNLELIFTFVRYVYETMLVLFGLLLTLGHLAIALKKMKSNTTLRVRCSRSTDSTHAQNARNATVCSANVRTLRFYLHFHSFRFQFMDQRKKQKATLLLYSREIRDGCMFVAASSMLLSRESRSRHVEWCILKL